MPLDATQPLVLKFVAGLHTSRPETLIEPTEAADGVNFDFDFAAPTLKRRKSIELVATTPNAKEVRGYAQLEKLDGTFSTLIQAGDTVYEWDGTSAGFTVVGTVSPAARLRGESKSNSLKDETVYIADLEQQEVVKTWDGTTFQTMPQNLGGDFFARHIVIERERAWYYNIKSGTALPHYILASKQDDLDNLSTANRPSDSLAADDPFFLPSPNLRSGVGLLTAFGRLFLATERGNTYELLGNSAKNHELQEVYAADVTSDEGFIFVGNDIVYASDTAIESLSGTDAFGDVDTDDLTRWILPDVKDVSKWRLAYSSRHQKIYCLPRNSATMFVLNKRFPSTHLNERTPPLIPGTENLSPWTGWQTEASFNMDASTLWTMKRPTDLLEFPYMGGKLGEIYQLESETGQDTGSNDVTVSRTSGVFDLPPREMYDFDGWIRARKTFGGQITVTLLYARNEELYDEPVTVTLDAASNAPVFGGDYYFGGDTYFGLSFNGRFHRKTFAHAGVGNQFQIKVAYTGAEEIEIEEIGLTFKANP